MHAPGVWGIVVVAVVVILLFGRGKISGLMGEVASGIKAFRGGLKDDDGGVDETPTVSANAAPNGSRVP